jgi:NDP-sugar pyrophosphorylase family protein
MEATVIPQGIPFSAAILAGGLGTRLRPAVADRPKVLAPVGGRPFVCYLLDLLHRHSVREVVLLTGHNAAQVRAALGDSYRGMRLRYSTESAALGTAGAVRLALPLLPAPRVLLLNGDSYCDVNLAAFARRHDEVAAGVSLALCEVADAVRFGRVQTDAAGRVVRFEEKQPGAGKGWINAGVYLLQRELIEPSPADWPVSLEREMFPAWVGRGLVWGQCGGGRFLDIGTPDSYAQAEAFFQGVPADAR